MRTYRALTKLPRILVAFWLLRPLLARDVADEEERLIGWAGETYRRDPVHPRQQSLSGGNGTRGLGWIQVVSWKPRVAIFHNFLSDAEARHILLLAAPYMQRSEEDGGGDEEGATDARTSYGTFLRRRFDPVVAAVEERVALWSHLPVAHQEALQVLRYGVNDKYSPHFDAAGRVATVLMYLVEPEEGGETAFVNSEWQHPELRRQSEEGGLSECARGRVAYKPRRGDALIFYDTLPDYRSLDRHSEHTGCPVVRGVKWNAVTWIHGQEFDPEDWAAARQGYAPPRPDPGHCGDYDSECAKYAAQGDCEENRLYMVGGAGFMGTCRRACGACEVCGEGDADCARRNRRRGGYLELSEEELQREIGRGT
ncbi:hypothetical protein HYH03_001982 [Edaphochlamys debaryana]|uniref:Fe2OG dioxygenase domain-containing protein n=1 Tax=Edaphochlamys debaryana TaxID=47281 RepID=A0A836C671_9CHLO|nr:hypothetical protein HYH03_001982 [Edaphochlamys debaryana]|eukprot:KAG2500412.1 hypothetical protein HYH03_001982 [Edaphochlamys debaryana]